MRSIFICLVVLFASQGKAQTNADSIFNAVQKMDSNLEKVRALSQITRNCNEHSFKNLFRAIDLMTELAIDSSELYILYNQNNQLGNYFRYLGLQDKALEYFERNNQISNKIHLMPEYLNIGLIYNDQNDEEGYQLYMLKARNLSTYGPNNQAYGYYFYGRSIKKEKPDSAKYYIDSAIAIWEAIPLDDPGKIYHTDKREYGGLTMAYNRLGLDALKNNDLAQAKEIYQKLRYWIHFENCNWVRLYELKAKILQRENKLDSAVIYGEKALASAMKPNCNGMIIKSFIASMHDMLYTIYQDKNNYKEAFNHYKNAIQIRKEIENSANQKAVQYHRYTKESLKAEKEYQLKIAGEKNTKNIAIAFGIMLLLAAGAFYYRWRFVRKSKAIIEKEKEHSDNLLHNILPEEVAAELKAKGESEARDFENVTVLFTDFIEFTQTAEKLSAKELVHEINVCFRAFDEIVDKYQLEKIKTIGDAYMAAGGLHIPKTSEPKDVINAALEMQTFMLNHKRDKVKEGKPFFEMRVGVHTGPVVAGIVGIKKFQYDIWGDTVNTASRMESHGQVGKVNISKATYEAIKEFSEFQFETRGMLEAKGKGRMEMYFVSKQ